MINSGAMILRRLVFGGVSATHSPTPSRSIGVATRRIRVMFFIVSVGAHAVAIFCIAHLVWQLRKHQQHQQQQQQNRRNGRPRSLSPPKKPLDVSDAQMQALVDRLQRPTTGGDAEDSQQQQQQQQTQEDEMIEEQLRLGQGNVSQWEEQLQTITTERDSLKGQVDRLLEEKTALELSKQQLESVLSEHESQETLRNETGTQKELNSTLNKENEFLRNEVGRLTELVDQMKKAQEVFRSNRLLAMPSTIGRTNSGKKLSTMPSPGSSPQLADS